MLEPSSPPDHVRVRVDYYDEAEGKAFSSGAYPAQVDQIARTVIEIPMAEFLTYYQFEDKEHRLVPTTLDELRDQVLDTWNGLRKWVSFENGSILVKPAFHTLPTGITKQLGDAVSMAVANRIHDLTEADWGYIPRAKVKTLDWWFASDGKNLIEIEAKGRFVHDASRLSELSDQRRKIREKKKDAAAPDYHRPPALRYGTILAIDSNAEGIAHCRLVDPDGTASDLDPMAMRLLHRLRWARNLVGVISRRSDLTVALANRLAALEQMESPWVMNEVPLERGSGEPIDLEPADPTQYSSFFAERSVVEGGPIGGVVTRIYDTHLLFIGIHEDWLTSLARQDFDQIMSLKFEAKTLLDAKLFCMMSRSQMEREGLGTLLQRVGDEKSGSMLTFRLPATIHLSPSGFAFGFARLPED